MNPIRQDLIFNIEKIIKKRCKNESIPVEKQAAPDVTEVWNACLANFEIWEIANEIVEAMEYTLKSNAFKLLIEEEHE